MMMSFLPVFLLVSGFVLLAVFGMAVRILFVKGGSFPKTHIEGNPAMRRMGIHCAQQDREYCQGLTGETSAEHNTDDCHAETCVHCAMNGASCDPVKN